jgi:hypothetical protein
MKEMEDAGADYAFINYAGAVHGFTNPKAGTLGVAGVAYNQKADERSWRLMQDWLTEAFGGNAAGGEPKERRQSVGPADVPAALSDAEISKMARVDAMKEWSARKKFLTLHAGLGADDRGRLEGEIAKLKVRMEDTRASRE